MPPIYTWECAKCAACVEITRPFGKYEDPPTEHEAPEDVVCNHQWSRKIPKGTTHTHAPGYEGRKGAW